MEESLFRLLKEVPNQRLAKRLCFYSRCLLNMGSNRMCMTFWKQFLLGKIDNFFLVTNTYENELISET